MPLNTVNSILSGYNTSLTYIFYKATVPKAANTFASTYYAANLPGADGRPGGSDVATSGLILTSSLPTPTSSGHFYFPPFVDGGKNAYLTRLEYHSSSMTSVTLADRLWQIRGINTSSLGWQSAPSLPWPDRCPPENNTNMYMPNNSGFGIFIGVEITSGTSNGLTKSDIMLDYTNSLGVTGRMATLPTISALAVATQFCPFILDSGDTGVQSVQRFSLGSTYALSGALILVAYRPIVTVNAPFTAGTPGIHDAISLGAPLLYSGSVPFFITLNSSTAANIFGNMTYSIY
jgi:hypothetical protein